MTRVEKVKDTVFLLLFAKERYPYDVSKQLYGKDNKRIFAEFRELKKDGWIKKYMGKKTVDVEDKRAKNRVYYTATTKPIIDKIQETIILEPFDEEILKEILKSKCFKALIQKTINNENIRESEIDAVDFILSIIDILIIISDGIPKFKELTENIKTKTEYENAINSLRNNPIYQEKIPKITKELFDEEKPSEEIIDELPHLFIIPSRLSYNIKGISSFGKKYYEILPFFDAISKIFEE